MSAQEAANGFVSGELLLRSDENDDRCLPPALEKRLRDSLRGRVARKRCGRSLRRAAILREAAAERRGATVASIAASKTRGEGLVEDTTPLLFLLFTCTIVFATLSIICSMRSIHNGSHMYSTISSAWSTRTAALYTFMLLFGAY